MGKVKRPPAGRPNELSVPAGPSHNLIPGRSEIEAGSARITDRSPTPRERSPLHLTISFSYTFFLTLVGNFILFCRLSSHRSNHPSPLHHATPAMDTATPTILGDDMVSKLLSLHIASICYFGRFY